jgi:hypothetical protein
MEPAASHFHYLIDTILAIVGEHFFVLCAKFEFIVRETIHFGKLGILIFHEFVAAT